MKSKRKKKLYYISAEFLIGKLLSNNLINLGIYDEVKEILANNGKNISEIEEAEPEPSLGNGGLGKISGMFFRFYSYIRTSWRWYRIKLPFWAIQTSI